MKSIVLCDDSEPLRVLPLCDKYGFGIEIQGFYDANKIDNTDATLSLYNSILPSGIEKHFHAPFADLCLGSANEKIVEVTNYFFDYAYTVADELGCSSITVHHGFVPHTSHPANWVRRSTVFWENFFDAHPGEIRMFMENQCEQNPETLIGIIDTCQCDRLGINLDIGHAHCNCDLSVLDWIRQLNSQIKYVHLHQNHGVCDEHLGLSRGNIPMKEVSGRQGTVLCLDRCDIK